MWNSRSLNPSWVTDTQGYPIVDQGGVAMATAIPTLNEWGLILLGLLIFGAAVLRIRRQRA